MDLQGRKGLRDTVKASRMWIVPTVSIWLAILNGFQGFFGPKIAVFDPKLQFLKVRSATFESSPWPPPLIFLLKLCAILLHTHRYHPQTFELNLKHHDRLLIFIHCTCSLLACCLLLAACCLFAFVCN